MLTLPGTWFRCLINVHETNEETLTCSYLHTEQYYLNITEIYNRYKTDSIRSWSYFGYTASISSS